MSLRNHRTQIHWKKKKIKTSVLNNLKELKENTEK